MNIVESYLKKNPCYTVGGFLSPTGILVETVGCPQPNAKVLLHNWNRESQTHVCPHILVDGLTDNVYQTLPFDMQGHHADDASNTTYIGIMLCEPSNMKYRSDNEVELIGDTEKAREIIENAKTSAAFTCAKLCMLFNFDPLTQIHSRLENVVFPGPKKSHPEHLWKLLDPNYDMDGFRQAVKAAMSTEEVSSIEKKETFTEQSESISEILSTDHNAQEKEVNINDEVSSKDDGSFMVRVTVDNLRIRKGPGTGTGCEPTGEYTGAGEFSIIEVQNGNGNKNGWGRLGNGKGWISLDFAERI